MYNYKDKKTNINNFSKLMFDKTSSMFKYGGLPESLPEKELEMLLQKNGSCVITKKYNNKLTAFKASFNGKEKDPYNRPVNALVSEPCFNDELKVGEDCVIIHNDSSDLGLQWLYEKYGSMLTESDITLMLANFNLRMQHIISGNDDNTISSIKEYLDKIENGELGVIVGSKLFDSLNVQSVSSNGDQNIQQITELQQYLKASLYNEVGLSSNWNTKRERLTSGEVDANNDNLRPLVDNMLLSRQKSFNEVNDIFGTSIKVDFSSIWKIKKDEDDSRNESKNKDRSEVNTSDEQVEQKTNQDSNK